MTNRIGRKWSPTKSSWLEAALKKGSEGPPSKNPPPMDPTTRDPPANTPTKAAPPVLPKPANLLSRNVMDNAPYLSSTSVALNQVTSTTSRGMSDKLPVMEKPTAFVTNRQSQPPPVFDKPSSLGGRPVPGPKVQLDFRGNLRPRNSPSGSPEKEDLPFLNAMSRLRSTKTQNYKAPDEFKESILARKQALQETGPPQPKTPDPVKQRLMSAKGALRHSGSSSPTPSSPGPERRYSTPKPFMPTSYIKAPVVADKRIPNLAGLLSRGPPGFNAGSRGTPMFTTTVQPDLSPPPLQTGKGGDGPLVHVSPSTETQFG